MSEVLRIWVTQELNRRGWTHTQLAINAGVSRPAVSNTLRGVLHPSCEFCIKVANALDVAPEYLLRLAGILPPGFPATPVDSPTLQQLVELARTLPAERQEEALRYVQFLSGQK